MDDNEKAALRYLAQVHPADAFDERIAGLLRSGDVRAIGDCFAGVKVEGDEAIGEAEYLRERRGALLDEIERLRAALATARHDALTEAIVAVNEEGGEYDFVYVRRIESIRGGAE